MNAAAQRIRHLGIDLAAKTGQAAERRLHMPAGTAKPVIQIEVPERGVEIVEPHQADDAAAEPDAFGVSARAVDGLRGLQELVGLPLVIPGDIDGGGRSRLTWILCAGIAALGKRAADTDQEGEPGNGEMAQNRTLKLKHPSTHRFPDLLPSRGQPGRAGLMPSKWVPIAAATPVDSQENPSAIPMTDISDFVQQSHNFIAEW